MVFITASFYMSGLMFIDPTSVVRNVVGWAFIALLTCCMGVLAVKHFWQQVKYIKQLCIGRGKV